MKKLAILFMLFTLYLPLLSTPSEEKNPLLPRTRVSSGAMDDSAPASVPARNQGPTPFCRVTDGDGLCAQSFFACIAPIPASIFLLVDCVTAPCVWNNRRKDPESSAGRNHYGYWSRNTFAEVSGISSITVRGLSPEDSDCGITCHTPAWSKEDSN